MLVIYGFAGLSFFLSPIFSKFLYDQKSRFRAEKSLIY